MLRVAVAVTAAAVGSFLPHIAGNRSTLFLLLGLAWVPWASVVLFASDRPGNPLSSIGGPVGDVLVLFAVQALLPAAREAVLLGYLVVVAFAVYTVGRSFGAVLGAASIALAIASRSVGAAADRLGTAELVPFSVAVVALIVLVERTANLQARVTSRYERLQSKSDIILANVASAVVVTDGGGTIEHCNPAALHILALGDRGGAGRRCDEVLALHVGERKLDCSAVCPLLALDEGVDGAFGVEVWRHDVTGRRQPLLANATAVMSEDGGVEIVHSLRDVTRLKQAEEAKTLFLATASHELKTPLTVINGFAATLKAHPDIDGEMKEAALDAISVRAQELTRIVDRLLLSSRIEAGHVSLTIEDVDVVAVLQERVTATALATGRTITVELGTSAVPLVAANRDALVTVTDHLLDNALKYSPGGERVTVRVTAYDGPVSVNITDRGIGMDAEQARHCFDKFWQAESTDVRRYGGTGIGLYIVQSLVDAMGGMITVDSELGRGSTFRLQLRPAVAPMPEAARDRRLGEQTSIREFMRQIGVPSSKRTTP